MSLVTTTTDSSAASARHSAATSAVLPPPTGPPTPIRSARDVRWPAGAEKPLSSRCKEGHLRLCVPGREQLGQNSPGRRRFGGRQAGCGGMVRGVGQSTLDSGDRERIEAEQPDRGRAGAADQVVYGERGRVGRRAPASG